MRTIMRRLLSGVVVCAIVGAFAVCQGENGTPAAEKDEEAVLQEKADAMRTNTEWDVLLDWHVEDEKRYYYHFDTEETDFTDDQVIVILSKSATRKALIMGRTFTADDFNTAGLPEDEQIASVERGVEVTFSSVTSGLIKPAEYRSMLVLKIRVPGKENVLKIVQRLQQDDAYYQVGPNHFFPIDNGLFMTSE